MKHLSLLIFNLFVSLSMAQQYTDFMGAGHFEGISVTTSSAAGSGDDGYASIDGFPVEDTELLSDASRFLAQATLGYDYPTIQLVAAMGYEAWLDEQFSFPPANMVNRLEQLEEEMDLEEETFGAFFFRLGWWEMALREPDLLRQRINFALSQIFVVSSFGSDLFEDFGNLSAGYYDVLHRNAFGNYRQLLNDVSINPSMGLYLSHFQNPKSDPSNNIHPDENYAREVMQLFSIGLYELEQDGTPKRDANNVLIPTYNNDDIREFAKIFTGIDRL